MRDLGRLMAMAVVVLALAPAAAQAGTATRTITAPGETRVVFPANVTSVTAEAVGAEGGRDYATANTPGLGGRATGTLAITSGQALFATVGVGGGDGGRSNTNFLIGGVGGGASDVRTCSVGGVCPGGSPGTRRIVAGGGGGSAAGGTGGNAGAAGGSGSICPGGVAAGPGGGATTAAGGTGGSAGGPGATGSPGQPGAVGLGGAGGNTNVFNGQGGGGGGGGWYGGGGGGGASATNCDAGGGGGGSSYLAPGVTAGSTGLSTTGTPPSVTFTYQDAQAPALALTAPAAGARTGSVPAASGTAGLDVDDDATVTVRFYVGGTPAGAVAATVTAPVGGGGAFTATPPGALADGTYLVRATQGDRAGNTATADRVVTLDTTAPAVAIAGPVAGQSFTAPARPPITGTAGTASGDAATVTLALYDGYAAAGTPRETLSATVDGTGAFATAPGADLPAGTYTVQAAQSDDLGHAGSSPAVTFVVAAPAAPAATPPPASPPAGAPFVPPAVAVPSLAVDGATARARQLLLDKRTLSVRLSCGSATCRTVTTGSVTLGGRTAGRLGTATTTIPAGASVVVGLPSTRALRDRVRRALRGGRTTRAVVRITATFTIAGQPAQRRTLTITVRRLQRR